MKNRTLKKLLFDVLKKKSHEKSHDLEKYSLPKINNCKGDLSKNWYIYYSFRNPVNDKLTRQKNVYISKKKYTTYEARMKRAFEIRDALTSLLEKGKYNPYETDKYKNDSLAHQVVKSLEFKAKYLAQTSIDDLKYRVKFFLAYLKLKKIDKIKADKFTNKHAIDFLTHILETKSVASRNNYKQTISSVFHTMVKNKVIKHNPFKDLGLLKHNPKRNKTYTDEQIEEMFEYMSKTDPYLLLYIKTISYNFLRSIEAVRLKYGNINWKNKTLMIESVKSSNIKIKRIPNLLLKELEQYKGFDANCYFFTDKDKPSLWDKKEKPRRAHFQRRFNKVAQKFSLEKGQRIHSFRHYFCSKLYRSYRLEGKTPFEAKSAMLLVTGHSSMEALEKYLRSIDAELPDDYSKRIS